MVLKTIRCWIRAGKLRSEKVGTQRLVDEQQLEAFVDDEMLPLPREWRLMRDGTHQPNWVRILREIRQSR